MFLGIHGAASAVFRTDFEQEELLAAPNAALKSIDIKGRARLRQVKEPERIARSVSSDHSKLITPRGREQGEGLRMYQRCRAHAGKPTFALGEWRVLPIAVA